MGIMDNLTGKDKALARLDENLGEFDEFRTAHLFHWRESEDQPD